MTPLVVDSITKLPADSAGRVVVSASHGGLYAAKCALAAGVAAVTFNDAGRGRDDAGVAGLRLLDPYGRPAAAVSHRSARIGDGADCLARGVVSAVNSAARALGAIEGMTAREVARRFEGGRRSDRVAVDLRESRETLHIAGVRVVLLDSVSLVEATDRDAVIVTASHGGLLGGDPASALSCDAIAAVFNDAGVGIDDAGLSRLPALDARSIAAVTVATASARIGDARSTWTDGVISHANGCAMRAGASVGQPLRAFVASIASARRV